MGRRVQDSRKVYCRLCLTWWVNPLLRSRCDDNIMGEGSSGRFSSGQTLQVEELNRGRRRIFDVIEEVVGVGEWS